MNRIFREIAQVVAKYEGFIEKYVGDAVMALFGVPRAHEDDPVRAIRAAREIHALVESMSPQFQERIGQSLTMHTGINTGLVVTGEVDLDEGTHRVAGDAINLTARLCSLAAGGEILVGADTYHQARGSFTFKELEPAKVKGKHELVRIYKVLSSTGEPRKIRRIHGLRAKLIGRKLEMARLAEAVEKLRQGESSVWSILGNAGTGKSRLVEEFKGTLDLEEIQWREGHSNAYSQNMPYSALIDLLNRAFLIKEGDPPGTVKKKVESSLESLIGKREDVIPYIGSLYALNYPEIERVDPEFWKIRLHQAIQVILSALVQRAPTIVCFEDIHWADPSSLDLLRSTLSEFRHPALFVLVYRPYFTLFTSHQLSTLGKSYEEIRLKDLSASEAQEMTESLLKTKTIPTDLQRFVKERVEGNPFYLEEVINSLIESNTLIRDNGTWRLARSISESGISPTIHGVISGRLDRLEKEAKRVLQEASVIGRTFHYEILKSVTDLKEQMDECLGGLEQLELIRTKSLEPELEYIFKHGLTQEVVYEGILKKERRVMHERIGLVVEKLFQERLSEFYETLAFHFKKGQSILKAVDYLMKSADKSWKMYAVEQSYRYGKEAFDLLTNKPDKSKEEEGLLIDLINHWAFAFWYTGDFRSLENLLRAHANIVESLDDRANSGMFYKWLGVVAFCRERYRNAYQYLRSAIKLGEETDNKLVIAPACSDLAFTCAELGFFEEGISFGERALEIGELLPSDQKPHFHFYPLAAMAYIYWKQGNKKKALEKAKVLLDCGQRTSNMPLAWAHWIMGLCCLLDGDFQSAIEHSKKGIQISQFPMFSQLSKTLLGVINVYHGQFHEAEGMLREVVTYSEKFGHENIGRPANMYLGVALIGQGRMAKGLRMIEQAQGLFLKNERKYFYAMSEYILGKVYLQIVERATPMTLSTIAKNIGFLIRNVPFASKKAEYHFKKAIEVAKEVGAKAILGQAYLDLGLLHKAKGRMDQAREFFSTSIELFEQCEAEGYLKQAKEALASVE
jgi:tetratricopeptide (TPR) repeat protein